MTPRAHDLLLLTGAGFTKNFNGFTALEMWSKIFNDQAMQSPTLLSLLRRDFNFESVYETVLEGNFAAADKETISDVVKNVYRKLDDATRSWVFESRSPTAFDIYKLIELIELFHAKDRKHNGFFFTLNQDLLVERRFELVSLAAPDFPVTGRLEQQAFSDQWWVTLPSGEPTPAIESALQSNQRLHYVKLHGSYGWRSSGGSSQMVIGTNKEATIGKEPLLRHYIDLFQSAIREGGKRLLVIGYGFRDVHINKILCEGVTEHGLRLIVMTTATPEQFLNNFMQGGHYYARNIWEGVTGFFPYSFREVFPPNQSGSVHLEELKQKLLQ